MPPKKIDNTQIPTSNVEKYYLSLSGRQFIYPPTEKIPVIQVANFPMLGQLTALRFLEWVQNNPDGVIALPTGKTPEHFIKWVGYYLTNWHSAEVIKDLEMVEIDPARRPDMARLHFVQIDEFYPIDPNQQNSFYYYIQKYYIKNFGLDPEKALLINLYEIGTANNLSIAEIFGDEKADLSLRTRWAKNPIEELQKETIARTDQFCVNYESKIRALGGIGFFLGGIGPDGHIAFNIRGSDHYSTTRLMETNYETQAAAASDLGGIEIARKRLVITIGLDTITYNKDATAIIIAAGQAKANIVRDSIQNFPSIQYPATVLQKLPNARFYLTEGAASKLFERRYEKMAKSPELEPKTIEKAVINLTLEKNKKLTDLTLADFNSNRFTELILKRTNQTHTEICRNLHESIINRIDRGIYYLDNEVFMHTSPHHDDEMLGYLPYIVHLVRNPRNKHYFTYMTSGFTAVTNSYVLERLKNLQDLVDSPTFQVLMQEHYFDPANTAARNRDVNLYLDGVALYDVKKKTEAESRRLLSILTEIYEENNVIYLKDRISELINYCATQYPGKKDIAHIQKLKGMIREWEADVLWGYFGFNSNNVFHLRLGFYKGDIFSEEPTLDRDVLPIYQLMKRIKPTIITVALDPEGSGPDTHYKVLQAITEALKLYEKEEDISNLRIWGYRNVWHRFHPASTNIYVPVSLNSMAIMENAFMESFGSQRSASFPSWEFDGPFCRLARKIQVDQYLKIKTCLGRDFFIKNEHPRLCATHGFVFIKELTPKEFYRHSEESRRVTENL